MPERPEKGVPEAWKAFSVDPGTAHLYLREGPEHKNRILRLAARPAKDSISVWLRARSKAPSPFPFKAYFDGFSLRRVRTGVPGASP